MKQLVIAILLISLLLSACSTSAGEEQLPLSERTINVVTTTGMIADITKNVGGDRVQVTALMGPGVDPHLYKASEGDVLRLQEADVIFYNGLHLEAQMGEVLERLNEFGIKTVAVTDQIDRSLLQSPPEFQGNYDPHVWFDVSLWMKAVEQVRDTLVELDSSSASQCHRCRREMWRRCKPLSRQRDLK
jgi:manganese/zinc/iron transport system substrate-binding protein